MSEKSIVFYGEKENGEHVGYEHKLDRALAIVALSEARVVGAPDAHGRVPIHKAMIGAWIASEKHRRNGPQALIYLIPPDATAGSIFYDELSGVECEKLARDFELFVFGAAAKGAAQISWAAK